MNDIIDQAEINRIFDQDWLTFMMYGVCSMCLINMVYGCYKWWKDR